MSDKVFIRVVLYKCVMRFMRKGKLALKYIDLYEIVKQVDKVAYKFALLENMNVFYVSSLYKYIGDLSHMLKIEEIELLDDLSYEDRRVHILDMKNKQLIN